MIELLISTLGGFLLHQFARYTDRMPTGWRELSNYAIGIAGSLPFIGLFWWRLDDVKDNRKRSFIAYLLGFLGIGSGVAIGWFMDTIRKQE